jgi:hypothetical protein
MRVHALVGGDRFAGSTPSAEQNATITSAETVPAT